MTFLADEAKGIRSSNLLSEEVKEISWRTGRGKVKTGSGQRYEADRILITVPLGVLQSGRIVFTPALPEYVAASKNIGFGGVIKFIFEFNSHFWETLPLENFHRLSFYFQMRLFLPSGVTFRIRLPYSPAGLAVR